MCRISADLGLLGQAWRAAGEHHAQLIVLDLLGGEKLLDGGGQRPFAFQQAAQFGRESAGRALASQDVERTVFRGHHQPGRGILGHAAELPDLECAAESVLHHVFRQRQVVDSEDARERGHHAPRFMPEEMIARLHHIFMILTGRTSTAPSVSKMGQPLESSTA